MGGAVVISLIEKTVRKGALHNGKEDRAQREPCNGDYQHGEKKSMAVQGGIDYLAGHKYHSGSNVVY